MQRGARGNYKTISKVFKYSDDREPVEVGCSYYEDCFSCPYEKCLHELASRTIQKILTEESVLRLWDEGLNSYQIADRLGKSRETVLNHLRQFGYELPTRKSPTKKGIV